MRKKRRRSPSSIGRTYSEQQLVGLRAHTQGQKQTTVDRLRAAILALETSGQPISARTIQEKCGLEYASIRRNPEALALYQQHSTFFHDSFVSTDATGRCLSRRLPGLVTENRHRAYLLLHKTFHYYSEAIFPGRPRGSPVQYTFIE